MRVTGRGVAGNLVEEIILIILRVCLRAKAWPFLSSGNEDIDKITLAIGLWEAGKSRGS